MEANQKVTKTLEQRQADQVDELKELQAMQMAAYDDPSVIKMIKANLDPKYQVRDYERDYVHLLLTMRLNNEATKSYIDETKIVQIHPGQFDQLIATGIFAGYDDAKVIHDPRTNRPKDYKLKAEPVAQAKTQASAVDDSVLAAKEQRIADLERRLANLEGKPVAAELLPDLDEDIKPKPAPAPANKKR